MGIPPVGTYPVLATYSGDANLHPGHDGNDTVCDHRWTTNRRSGGNNNCLDRDLSMNLPTPQGTGPFSYNLISGPPHSDGTCTLTKGGTLAFLPAHGFTGVVQCGYTVTDTAGMTSKPALVTINVVGANTGGGKGVAIPGAHTGEPWSGGLYWMLVSLIGIGGVGVLASAVKRNVRPNRR